MAGRIRGAYDERFDTPPIVTEYQQNKLASARVRWRAFKIFTWVATITAGVLAAFDERLVTGSGLKGERWEKLQNNHALSWVRSYAHNFFTGVVCYFYRLTISHECVWCACESGKERVTCSFTESCLPSSASVSSLK